MIGAKALWLHLPKLAVLACKLVLTMPWGLLPALAGPQQCACLKPVSLTSQELSL